VLAQELGEIKTKTSVGVRDAKLLKKSKGTLSQAMDDCQAEWPLQIRDPKSKATCCGGVWRLEWNEREK
jgi:hypothetical protein